MSEQTTNELLKELIGEIKSLKEDIKPKEDAKEEKKEEVLEEPKAEDDAGPTAPADTPVPSEYREVVETVLNKLFGIRVVGLTDRPAFQLEITVPKKYSNATKEHLETYGADVRSRVIDYALGSNGVRDWCEKIYKNLGTEAQSRIIEDRQKDNLSK